MVSELVKLGCFPRFVGSLTIFTLLLSLEEAYQEILDPEVKITANQGAFNEYITSQCWFTGFLSISGSYQLATKLLQRVVARDKKYFGLEHLETLASTGELASAWWNQGRLKESEELEVQIMDTRKKLLGLEHLDTLISMDNFDANLASTYQHQGRCREAEKLHMQVMQTLEPR